MSDHILNQAGFWLPPDFLSDDDDQGHILVNSESTLFPDSVSASRVPFDYKSALMKTQLENDSLANLSTSFSGGGLFAPRTSQSPKSPMLSGSPQSRIARLGSFKSSNGSSNATSPATSRLGENDSWKPQQQQRPSASNHSPESVVGLCSDYKGRLNHHFSPTRGRPITEVYCSQQKIMVHNRGAGERSVIGYADSTKETGGWRGRISAWPHLPQQLPKPLLWRACSGMGGALLGGSETKRECAGTGVFFPRRYGKLPDSSGKKPADGMGRKKLQQLMHHHKKLPTLQKEEDVSLTHELCLPHEWTY